MLIPLLAALMRNSGGRVPGGPGGVPAQQNFIQQMRDQQGQAVNRAEALKFAAGMSGNNGYGMNKPNIAANPYRPKYQTTGSGFQTGTPGQFMAAQFQPGVR